MRSVCILGNGPSLQAERIPEEAMPLGVNRSHEVAWAPIACTIDERAWRTMERSAKALLYICRDTARAEGRRVMEWEARGPSGCYAVRAALELLGPWDRIYLLGFDPDTLDHFYGPDPSWVMRERKRVKKDLSWWSRDKRFYRWADGWKPLAETITWYELHNVWSKHWDTRSTC